ncbi:MAG: hypothetical protein ACH350_08015 [Parachlamydiaceae bacterium]
MRSRVGILSLFFLLFFHSCAYYSKNYEYFYSHLQSFRPPDKPMVEDDYFLVLLVDACHLDYTDAAQFFQSVAIHPMNRSRRGDLGHAWIYLQGKLRDGTIFVLEGGHSGEREAHPPRYFEGLMNYNQWGYANPSAEDMSNPRYEPNPIKYLWTIREDGFFQKGSGGHHPSFAAKISLSKKKFEEVLAFIRPSTYPYSCYALMGNQCCSFVAHVAGLAGIVLKTKTSMRVSPLIYYGNRWIRLWENPCYSILTFATPDILEKSLIEAVQKGRAEYALDWYIRKKLHR